MKRRGMVNSHIDNLSAAASVAPFHFLVDAAIMRLARGFVKDDFWHYFGTLLENTLYWETFKSIKKWLDMTSSFIYVS